MGFDVEGHDLSMGEKKKDGQRHHPKRHAALPCFAQLADCAAGEGGYATGRASFLQRAAHPNEEHAMKRLMILNGPNLNLLGVREPHIYGTTTLAQVRESCEQHAKKLSLELSFHQSNHEGEIVDWIQSARQTADAIIINPAGYSFTSIAILDAIKAFEGPVVEVHISNIHARDEHHRHSKISSAATGVICGLGPYGYIAAMDAVAQMKKG
jgi:3-dehydroquinate dehydratase-2